MRAVAGAHGVEEREREPGDEVEDGRGVGGDAHGVVGLGVELVRRHAADVGEPVAEGRHHPADRGDVAGAVLEADEVRARVGEPREGIGREPGVGPVVDDDPDLGRLADGADVGGEAGLGGLGQVVRQEQDTVRPGGLDLAGEVGGHGGAVAAAGEDRHVAGGGLGGPDGGHDLAGAEREELARAAGGEEAGRGELRQPRDMLGVGPGREAVLGVEGGDGEGEEAGADLRLQLLRGHAGVSLACVRRASRR